MKTDCNWSMHLCGVILLLIFGFGGVGCGVYMAAKQPREKDLSVLNPGTPRGHVIAELGAPTWSGERDGNKVDIFTFVQGYSTANRSARALFHGVSDVFSLGLWEVIATPVEGAFSGTTMKVEVTYDEREDVRLVKNLGGGATSQSTTAQSTSEDEAVPAKEDSPKKDSAKEMPE